MTLRGWFLLLFAGGPILALLLFGPRHQMNAPDDRVRVRYWGGWSGVEAAAMQAIVDDFNQTVGATEKIWVEYHAISNIDQRLLISTAGGDPPDISGLYDYALPSFADRDALQPMDRLVAEYGIDTDAFKPAWLKLCRYEGQLYALPSAPYTMALFYNRELFRKAGLDPDRPPQTIAELDEAILRLTRVVVAGREMTLGEFRVQHPVDAPGKLPEYRIVQLGFTQSPAMLGWWHWVWPNYFHARLWDGSAFQLDTPEARAAYEWIAAQRKTYGMPAALTFESAAFPIEGAQNPFLGGHLAMVLQGPWLANWARTYTPDLDYGVAAFPSVDARQQNVFASTDVFVIPTGARRVHEAMIFLRYVMQQPVLERLSRAHGKVSPFRTPLPQFYAEHPNPFVRAFDELANSPATFGYPAMPMWNEATQELLVLLEHVLTGRHTVAAGIAQSQRHIDKVVKRYQSLSNQRTDRREAEALE